MNYEYIRAKFDFGDMEQLNRLGSIGWRVVSVQPVFGSDHQYFALMMREIPGK